MYKLQPLFKSVGETPHPSCVYKMKKISDHFNNNVTENNGTDCDAQDSATPNNVIDRKILIICLHCHLMYFSFEV